jgi:predicted Fe-Mo cluster-binding NifX family protein
MKVNISVEQVFLQEAKVAVLRANSDTVNGVISSYVKDELEELTEGCHHAHHK